MTDPDDQLLLRAVDHPHAQDAYRVVWRGLEVGSIGLQRGAGGRTFWRWWIFDHGYPCRELTTMGDTIGRDDAMAAFRTAWDVYAADPGRIDRLFAHHADIIDRSKRWGGRGE